MARAPVLTLVCVLVFTAPPAFAADPPVILVSQVRDTYPQLSRDGTRIVFQSNRSGTQQIWLVNADGLEPRQLTRAQGEGAETPSWSPDGEHIAYAVYLDEGNNDVFVMRADGSDQKQLTFEPGYDDHPHWSADGRRIVFNSDRDTPDRAAPWEKRWHEIWSMDADGGNLVKHTECKSACTFGSLSPDGKFLLYRRVDDSVGLNWLLEAGRRNSEIYVLDLTSGETRNLAPHPAFDGWPAWSPDGGWIVFASNRSGPPLSGQLWVIRPDGGELRQITHGDWSYTQPAWTASGDAISAYRFQEKQSGEYGGVAIIPFGGAAKPPH